MEKIGYHGRFISRTNKVDTLKVDNIENNMVDRVHDASHLMFHGSCIHIKIESHRLNQISEENGGRVREGKNTTEKEDDSHCFAIRINAGARKHNRMNRNIAAPDRRLLDKSITAMGAI